MIKCLFEMGVQPEALLLPRRPDQGKCKLCQTASLLALVDVFMQRCNGDLSMHKEVSKVFQLASMLAIFSARHWCISDMRPFRLLQTSG